MKAIIDTVNFQLSLEEVQMLAQEIAVLNHKFPEGKEGHNIMIRKVGEMCEPVIKTHKVVQVVTNYRIIPNS